LGIPSRYDLDVRWDACLHLSIRRVAYSSLAGTFTGLLLFRKQ
jgi:inner membrane organizing system protein 1